MARQISDSGKFSVMFRDVTLSKTLLDPQLLSEGDSSGISSSKERCLKKNKPVALHLPIIVY